MSEFRPDNCAVNGSVHSMYGVVNPAKRQKRRGRPPKGGERKWDDDSDDARPITFFEGDRGRGTPEERREWIEGLIDGNSDKYSQFMHLSDKWRNKLTNGRIKEVTPICAPSGAVLYLEIRGEDEEGERFFVNVFRACHNGHINERTGEFFPVVLNGWGALSRNGLFFLSGAREVFTALFDAKKNGATITLVFCEGLHAKRGVERLFADNPELVAAWEKKHGTKLVVVSWQAGPAGAKASNLSYRLPPDYTYIGSFFGGEYLEEEFVDYRLDVVYRVIIVPDADAAGTKEAKTIQGRLIKDYALPPHKLFVAARVPGLTADEEGWDDDDPLPPGVTPEQRLTQILDADPVQPPPSSGYISFENFAMSPHGLIFDTGGKKGSYRISAPFKILALCRAKDNEGWGRLVEFVDPDGKPKQVHIANAELQGHGTEAVKRLTDAGLQVVPSCTKELTDYLASVDSFIKCRQRTVECTGWHDGVFVLPDETIGEAGGEPVVLINPGEHGYAQSGTLQEWKDSVGKLAEPHRLVRLGIATMFAGPSLDLLNAESGGLHFTTHSSKGKSTCQGMGASVFGKGELKGGYVVSWNTTPNALEGVAAARTDTGMPIDELSQADPGNVDAMIYLLGNGRGKGRMTRDIKLRRSKEFRVSVLSSGEKTAEEIVAERYGRKVPAGAQMRLVNVEADAGKGFGLFDTLAGFKNAQALVDAMRAASVTYYGTAGPAFIRAIVEQGKEEVTERLRKKIKAFEAKLGVLSGQAGRVARRFAIIAAAGELAIELEIAPWPAGSVASAAKWAFERWRKTCGRAKVNIEQRDAEQRFGGVFEAYGDSRFDDIHTDDNEKRSETNAQEG